ncbi:family S53 protease [Vararia minispora EC-137]|uniref:Family S53 protease n=1 Tax=Vararia minispora EC-137 TaxID=1314806 RepID=A0ACB8QDR8_9AGAM|nr:family S53 protease [Vararia minispora EC-137]
MIALSVFVFALSIVSATPLAERSMLVHERRDNIPSGFVKVGPAPESRVLNLRLGLVQGDMAGLEKRLMSVSSPSSPEFRQWLSKEEVEAFVAPKPETVSAINAFLSENGITSKAMTPTGDMLSISVTVAQANSLFNTQFDTFQHTESGTESVRTLEYSIPTSLKNHLEFVHPTTTFPQTLQRQPIASIPLPKNVPTSNSTIGPNAAPNSCASVFTPACLQALYGIPTAPATQSSNTLGVSGFIDQFANEADLQLFLLNLRPDIPDTTTFSLQTLDGGQNPQNLSQAGVEANLDTQYTVGVATGVPVTFFSVGDNTQDGLFGFLDLANLLLSQSAPPNVLTTSYGANEPGISTTLYNNLCNAYMQLGARGTSVFYSSGDGGVAGSQTTSCRTFIPTFPSGCPFLTSVGATNGVNPEVAASFSSGGFSNVFAQPSYQASAVSAYLNTLGNTNSGRFNRAGRAFPDVSAVGNNVEIAFQQQAGLVAGTSCSSPIFASIVSLLNGELVAAGKAPLGFLNPFLYSTGKAALTDITSGSNPGCGTNGFPATTGWDPVTGLGSPNFAALRTAVGL